MSDSKKQSKSGHSFKTKSMLASLLLATTLSGVAVQPAVAQNTPQFLQGIDAAPMTQQEMQDVRGQGLAKMAIQAVVAAARLFAKAATVASMANELYQMSSPPPYSFYQRYFGKNAMKVINKVPAKYRPMICNI